MHTSRDRRDARKQQKVRRSRLSANLKRQPSFLSLTFFFSQILLFSRNETGADETTLADLFGSRAQKVERERERALLCCQKLESRTLLHFAIVGASWTLLPLMRATAAATPTKHRTARQRPTTRNDPVSSRCCCQLHLYLQQTTIAGCITGPTIIFLPDNISIL